MKHFRLLALCFAVVVLLASVWSCADKDELNTPEGVFVEYDTLTLRWKEVDGAKVYTVCIVSDGSVTQEIKVSKNYCSLEGLSPGRYSITVKANNNGDGTVDSALSPSVEFIRDNESGIFFTLVNGGREYEVSGRGSASGVIEIPSTYRQKPVTSIGAKAFFGEGEITEVKLPDSVKSIGDFAFANCSYLKKVNIPTALSYLGESAFSGCKTLDGKITLPSSLKTVSNGAFAYCSSVQEVIFGEGVASIGKNAFTDCSGIKSLSFPSSVVSIGGFAFAACSNVSSVAFGSGIEIIGEFAFSKVISLASVSLPDTLKRIDAGAFYYCSELSSVELGDGIEMIDHSAFLDTAIYNNSITNEIYVGKWFIGLKDNTVADVNFKSDTIGIANNALYANKSIQSIELPDSVERIGSLAFAESDIVSIETGLGVKYIGDMAFMSCGHLVTVLLGVFDSATISTKPGPLEKIGNYAFMNCRMLERIDIPDTVNDIGSYAFRNTAIFTNSVTGVVYADNWVVDYNDKIQTDVSIYPTTVGIARYAFYDCAHLVNVSIPGQVKNIGKGAFYNCVSLESVALPDSLRVIEDYTFYSCSKLRITSLPPMLEKIGRSAFYKCGTVKDYNFDTDNDVLRIPSGVTHIGDFAFFGCGYRNADGMDGNTETGGIDVIIIGDGVKNIGKCAFYGFASIKSVTVGSAETIGEKAFYSCPSLENILVSSALVTIGDKAFYGCGSLKLAAFPDTLKEIGDYSFYNCDMLEEVHVGKALEKIGAFAFFGNGKLEFISMPTSLSSIGEQAFRDCNSLTSVSLGSSVGFVGAHAFYSCDSLTVYTSLGDLSSGWSEKWNSSFCPVVWGAELSEEDNHVVCITVKDGFISNGFADTVLTPPIREGYTFIGWNSNVLSDEAEYSLADLMNIKKEIKLYSVWKDSE